MILDDIIAHKKIEVEALKQQFDQSGPPAASKLVRRDFAAALRSSTEISLIAEIKRRSPSKGNIRLDLDPAHLAQDYLHAGAAALSVLADSKFFGGSLDDVYQARAAVNLPVLRKDFIIDQTQIWQSADGHGPDAILLIVAALDASQLRILLDEAAKYGLACLVETHSEAEVDIAMQAGAKIIGINNRNLQTFTVDLKTTERLRRKIPHEKIIVSESGIHCREDVLRLQDMGIDAMLIGEAMLQAPDVAQKIKELLGEGS